MLILLPLLLLVLLQMSLLCRFNCCSDDGFVSVVIVCDVVLVSFILVATVNVSFIVCATVVVVATVDAANVWLI